jgi:signal transduction histidine kinase
VLKSDLQNTKVFEEMWNMIKKGEAWKGEIINRKKNGENYYEEMTITPLKNEHDEIINYIAIKDDISDRKRNEIELKKAKEDAERSDKLKSEFLAQMSHEIRTPINIISNFMQIYEDELQEKLTPELKSSISSVKGQSLRIISTIDSIVNMAQLNTGTFNPILQILNVYSDIIRPTIEQWESLAKDKNIYFNISSEFDNILIEGDAYSLSHAVNHIVDNAIKYTDKGGVEIQCKAEGDFAVINVSDTGAGISEEYLPFIFDPFSQEHQGFNRQYEGNGLGMALVKQYCLLNNASIKINSKKGVGTNVKVSIPVLKKGG